VRRLWMLRRRSRASEAVAMFICLFSTTRVIGR
jgi:hypothetical protein